MGLFAWFSSAPKVQPTPAAPARPRSSYWSTHAEDIPGSESADARLAGRLRAIVAKLPVPEGASVAMDDATGAANLGALKLGFGISGVPEALALWYSSQSFIGHQMCAILAQHWLIDKACTMPARDAVRNGFDIVDPNGGDLDPGLIKKLHAANRAMRLRWNMEQFVRMGRIFGIRIALFKVESTDPQYYENPFNADGVEKGQYKGIVQVDPYWCAPMMDGASMQDPSTQHFYEPTFWQINGRKYHRTHLIIFRNADLPDMMKPMYLYGGVPVPQRIMERVYGAERTANEAPQLTQTKRTTVWGTDMAAFIAKGDAGVEAIQQWVAFRDNYAVKMGDKEDDEFQQFDTSLADLDSVIMTQYQLVAAGANVPATKLLGTSPKGFGASGDYEVESYHEELEGIQEHDLTPFVERHLLLTARSEGIKDVELSVNWKPLDTPTGKELAEENLTKAQTGAALIASGALDGAEERRRLAMDPGSGYAGVDLSGEADGDGDELDDDPDAE